ncbi:MAG: hypothetical protein WCT04_19280 [Planctomycetota bacterium]
MRVTTTACTQFNHPEFVLDLANEALLLHANVLLRSIESLVAKGEVLRPGETFQFGWLTLQIRQFDKEFLTLYEPDMKSFPIEYVPGANVAIQHMMMQLFALDSFGIQRAHMLVPNMHQTVMTCDRFATAPVFFMTRNEPINHTGDTGWYMGCMAPDHDHDTRENLELTTLYDAFLKRNDIYQWLIFPTEAKIFLNRNQAPKVWIGEEKFPLIAESFVDEYFKELGGK